MERRAYVIHRDEQAIEQHPDSKDRLWIDLEEVDSAGLAPRCCLAVSLGIVDYLLYSSVPEAPIVRYTAEERLKAVRRLVCSGCMAGSSLLCFVHAVAHPESRLIPF